MARPKLETDEVVILGMREEGKSIHEIGEELNCSTATVSRRIAYLKNRQGMLTRYRELQDLHLIETEFRILESITDAKLQKATLPQLCKALKVLVEVRAALGLKDKKVISGFVDHVIEANRLREESKEDNSSLPQSQSED